MKTHIKNVHEEKSEDQLQIDKDKKCEFCGALCSGKKSLRTHIRRNHKMNEANDQKYKCDKCEKYFSTKIRVKLHFERVHLNIKNQKCVPCDKEFFGKGDYISHVENMKISNKRNLRRHMISVHQSHISSNKYKL